MVFVSCCFEGTGNIQHGYFAKTLVEAKIVEAGLEFAVRGNQVVYVGRMDRFRDVDVYQNCNGITWGVHFKSRAYECANQTEDWGGSCWPDKVTANKVAKAFIKNGTKDKCANLPTLKAMFPNHPSVAKLEAWQHRQFLAG